jgi:hypothetical protein
MRPLDVQRGPRQGLAADAIGCDRKPEHTRSRAHPQILDAGGFRLPRYRREPVARVPRRSTPGWYAWAAAERWRETGP